jgi:hypothetical protein
MTATRERGHLGPSGIGRYVEHRLMPTGVVEARYEEITHAEVAHVREGHRGTLRLTPVRGHAGSLPDRCRSHHISVSTPAVPHPTPIGPDGARVRGHYPPVVAPLVCKRSILQRECKRNDGPSANPGGGDRVRPPTREEGVPDLVDPRQRAARNRPGSGGGDRQSAPMSQNVLLGVS